MSNTLDNIGYNLILDDSGFRVTAQATAAQLKALEAQFASTGQGVAAIEAKINSAGVTFHQWVTSIGAVKFALMDLDSVFLALPKAVLETSGELEKLGVVLKGLSNAADDAGRSADAAIGKSFILNLEQNVPFRLQALTDTFVKFKTVGIDPMNGSMEALLNQVAKYGGGTEQLKSAALAIQQMAGKGVVSLQELRMQLSQAIPNAAQMMADAMGMSMGDLTKAISKGTVSSGMAIKKMLAAFSLDSLGAANEQMQTWMGTLEKLNTKWDLFKADVGDAGFFKAAKDELNSIMELFGTPDAKNWAQGLSNEFTSLVGLFHSARMELQEYLPQIIELGKVVLTIFATTTIAGWLGGMRDAFTSMNASWRDYAANAIASEGAIVTKKLSVTEQILAADQKRRDSIALESELRQDALAREIAANQKLMVELTAVHARRDDLRNADFTDEIAKLEKKLAANESYLAKLDALEQAHVAAVKEAQIEMALANNQRGLTPGSAEAAAALATVYKNEQAEKELALTREQIIFETQRVAVLNEEIATTKALMMTEQMRSSVMAEDTAALVAKNAALATTIGAERQAVASMTAMTAGAAELKAGIMGLQFAFNALGGWLTVLAAGIVGGIALWNQFGEAAKRAANAALDAANLRRSIAQGNVSQSQVEQADSHIEDKKAQIAALQNQLAIAQNGQRVDSGFQAPDPQAASAIRAQIAQEKSALDDLIRMRGDAQKDVDASNVKLVSAGYAKKYQEDTDVEVSQIAKTGQNEVSAIKKRYEDLRGVMDSQSPAFKASQDAEAKEVQAAIQKGTTAIAAAYDARDKELRAKIAAVSGPDAATQKAALEQELARVRQQEQNALGAAAAAAAPNQFVASKTPGHTAAPTDHLESALEKVKTQLAAARGQLREIVTGATEYDDLRADAEAKVREMWQGGKLDTTTHGKNGGTSRPDFNSPQVQGLIDDETMLTIVNNAKSQMTQLKGKLGPMVAEYNDTMAKLMAGDFTTPAGKEDNSTLKFLEKLSVKSQDAAKDLAPVIETIKQTKLAADQLDLANFARTIGKADQATQLSLISSPVDRMKAQFAQENAEWDAEALIKIQKVKELGGQVDAAQAIIDAARDDRMKLQAKQLETPMQQMVDGWQNATDEMQKASANWGNSTIDMFVNAAKTGKLQFTSLVESILTDMLKITMQKKLGGFLEKGYDSLANWAGGMLGGNNQNSQASVSPTGSASVGLGLTNSATMAVQQFGAKLMQTSGLAEKFGFSLGDKAQQMATSLTTDTNTTNSMATLTNAAYAAANALASIAGSSGGGSGGIGGMLASLAGAAASAYMGGAGSATSGMLGQTGSMGSSSTLMGVQGGTNTLGNWNYSGGQMSNQYKFADGGIMSEFGPLALRKYANGGIADSPQVAIYGEGSMNEAFVPLPDGRSIPVTITGGQQQGAQPSGASSVVVNVINQSGQQVQGQQQGGPRFDGKQMILDVVLTAASQPGNFRDQMKGALRT